MIKENRVGLSEKEANDLANTFGKMSYKDHLEEIHKFKCEVNGYDYIGFECELKSFDEKTRTGEATHKIMWGPHSVTFNVEFTAPDDFEYRGDDVLYYSDIDATYDLEEDDSEEDEERHLEPWEREVELLDVYMLENGKADLIEMYIHGGKWYMNNKGEIIKLK